ncbi:peptidoglycan DD-metalloendopeptidase family protein [Streptomyces sp. NPDC088258]|uniref:peptidoglycan DD-metalloendopeptidase family protein n=1 Tax=Streptomyces sp. NPDC088258 TaxID=3365849 RepID=UPI0038247B1C
MVTLRVLALALALLFLVSPGRSADGAVAAPVGALVAHPARKDVPDGGRAWPLGARPAVERGWQPPASAYGPGHRGVDLAAPAGATVRAAAAGQVSFSGRVAGRGVVSITLPDTGEPALRITYEPVDPLVGKGGRVVAGQPVATLAAGPWHCATGCLHWGLRRGGTYLDPLSLLPAEPLRRRPSRLLPVLGVAEPVPAAGPGARHR